jgi:hypothetical protein
MSLLCSVFGHLWVTRYWWIDSATCVLKKECLRCGEERLSEYPPNIVCSGWAYVPKGV